MPDAKITTTSKGWPLLDINNYIDVTPEYTKQLATKLENGDARVAEAINAAEKAIKAAKTLQGAGTWTEFKPLWRTGGVQLGIGNGILRGRFAQIGATVNATIFLRRGSTSHVGNGAYTFDVPLPIADHAYPAPIGVGRCTNGNKVILFVPTSKTTVGVVDSNLTDISSTFPGNWKTGDIISGSITYEAVV